MSQDKDQDIEFIKKYVIIVSCVIFAAFVVFIWPHTNVWDGEGTIDAFPDSDSVKSYRLNVSDMQVTEKRHGWFHSSYLYTIGSMDWPDGGESDFDFCEVTEDSITSCTDQDGNGYGIDVLQAPDRPDDDYDSSY